jgi:peptide/nickel transport system substrate-binding protein
MKYRQLTGFAMYSRLNILIFLLIFSLVLSGCRKPDSETASPVDLYDPAKDPLVNQPAMFEPPPQDISKIATDETLYITLRANPNTLNPLFVSSTYDFIVVDALYGGLYTFGKDMLWRLNEEMVESFEESEDHTEFIVKIKPGFKWHDGKPWTAHDIVYSWQQILDDRVPCLSQKPSVEPVKKCVALDDYTIKYVQPEPLATRYWNLSFPIIPKHIYEKDKENHPDLKTGTYYNQQARHPVGSGPYRIVEWKENSKIVLERWEDYAGKKPYFKQIVFRIIPDDHIALLSFEKQAVDVVDSLPSQKFALETDSDTFRAVGYKAWGVQWAFSYIGWNMDGSNPFFADRKVRYAMSHALNIPLILEKISYNLSTRCHGIYHPDSLIYNPEVKNVLLEYDLAKSQALLDEAGWKVNPDDGWRYKQINDQKVLFEFTLLMPQESSTSPKIAAIFQNDLHRIGVRLQTRKMEWSSFLEKVRKHEFQAEIASWGTGTDPDTSWNLWHSTQYEKGRNYGKYANPKVDKLFEQGRREFDSEKRRQIYQEIHKIVYEDQPYTWISNPPILAVFNKRIRGVQFSPRGIFNFNPSFEGWWVPSGSSKNNAAMP